MLFYTERTLAGLKLKVYVILKILKLLVQPLRKVTSYEVKFGVDRALVNMFPKKKEEIGKCVKKVLDYVTMKNRLEGNVHPGLAALGLERIEVVDDGLLFIGKKED